MEKKECFLLARPCFYSQTFHKEVNNAFGRNRNPLAQLSLVVYVPLVMDSQYDQFAHDFSQARKNAWPEFEILFSEIEKGDRLLDLGCGNGRLRHSLPIELVRDGEYFGLDASEKLLDVARKNFPKDHFFHKNFTKPLPFGDDNFDVVAGVASFHHILSESEQIKFLQECCRILKPGGTLFLTTWKLPKKHFWPNFWKGSGKNWVIPFGVEKHPRTYRNVTGNDLKKLLRRSGFHVESCELLRDRNYVIVGKNKK
jgi:ubiquinone/menaquinone biosynthesis C-methylase UbiE